MLHLFTVIKSNKNSDITTKFIDKYNTENALILPINEDNGKLTNINLSHVDKDIYMTLHFTK